MGDSSLKFAKQIIRLKKSRDFAKLRFGLKVRSNGFLFIGKPNLDESNSYFIENNIARLGFTVTRKSGNAVTRNRIKRRLKEAARLGLDNILLSGHDYNIVGHYNSLLFSFDAIVYNLQKTAHQYNKIVQKNYNFSKINS